MLFIVLSSNIFWLFYIIVSFILGTIILRHCDPTTFKEIKTGELDTNFSLAVYLLVIFIFYVLWIIPLIFLLVIILFNSSKGFFKLIAKIFRIIITKIDDLIPKFKKY